MIIEIHDWFVLPHAAFVAEGEQVSWVNKTSVRVEVKGVAEKAIVLEPDGESERLVSGEAGVIRAETTYFVTGRNVDAIGSITPSSNVQKQLDIDPAFLRNWNYTPAHWKAMLDPLCACWAYDVIDNIRNYAIDDTNGIWRVSQRALGRLQCFWDGSDTITATNSTCDLDAKYSILNLDTLLGATQSKLEPFARVCNVAWEKHRRLWNLLPQPAPSMPSTLGDSIKIIPNRTEYLPFYERQKNYMWSYFQIEIQKDGGRLRQKQAEELSKEYGKEACAAQRDDYDVLRYFLEDKLINVVGLSPSFEIGKFKLEFTKRLAAMTFDGKWSSSLFSLWNWLRFAQTVIGLEEDDEFPDLAKLSDQHAPFANSCESYFERLFAGNRFYAEF